MHSHYDNMNSGDQALSPFSSRASLRESGRCRKLKGGVIHYLITSQYRMDKSA